MCFFHFTRTLLRAYTCALSSPHLLRLLKFSTRSFTLTFSHTHLHTRSLNHSLPRLTFTATLTHSHTYIHTLTLSLMCTLVLTLTHWVLQQGKRRAFSPSHVLLTLPTRRFMTWVLGWLSPRTMRKWFHHSNPSA